MNLDFACVCDVTTYPYHEVERRARKSHKCYECSRVIERGERYHAVGGMCEGDWWNGKICSGCWSMLEWVRAHIPCVCVSFGNMREELKEICREAAHEAPGLLFGFYRRMLRGANAHA